MNFVTVTETTCNKTWLLFFNHWATRADVKTVLSSNHCTIYVTCCQLAYASLLTGNAKYQQFMDCVQLKTAYVITQATHMECCLL